MDGTLAPVKTKTTCPYCGVGCGVVATRHADGRVTVEGDKDHPANFGRLCSKGAALAETLSLDDRLLYPEIDGVRAGWDESLDLIASTFEKTIAEYGPDAVAFYVSGQCLTEDYYVANKLMKGFIGSANIDTNSRLCMASTVAGHNRAFGEDIVPGCYEDLEQADLIVLVGSNLAWCHPVLFQRIQAARDARPDMKLVVIDPRRTVTADAADLHLPIRPDGDAMLFNALLAHLYRAKALDQAFIDNTTEGFSAVLRQVLEDVRDVDVETGLRAEDIATFFDWMTTTEKTVTVFSQGVNQSIAGTDKVNAIINVHLATGRIGKPGMGPFSVTGQPNAMGGREVGGLANQLAAHMRLEDADHRDIVQSFWKSPTVADRAGLKAVDLFKAVGDGRIKAIWIIATNPVDSLPRSWDVERALKACPFVVVSDNVRETDTARHATVLLPATGWSEKDGTVTNSERRISRQRTFLEVPGWARHDWWALSEVAKRMGFGDAFDYASPAAIYREHAALSAYRNDGARAFDIGAHAALADDAYDALAPVQWPLNRDASRSGARGVPFRGGAKHTFVQVTPPQLGAAPADDRLVLNTGRIRDHWHTMTRTAKASALSSHYAEPFCALHPDDAQRLGISDADLVRLDGADADITVRALITDRQEPGACFVPMHWTDQLSSSGRVGKVIDCGVDPVSGQPGLKAARVSLSRYEARWHGFAVLREKPKDLDVGYWAMAKTPAGWRVELAHDKGCVDWPYLAERLFGIARSSPEWTAYIDFAQGGYRFARVVDGELWGALFVSAAPVAVSRAWLASRLGRDVGTGTGILAGRGAADQPDPGPMVCACFGVGANRIKEALRTGEMSVEAVGKATCAGTNCGSCKSEIQGIVDSFPVVHAAE